MTRQSALARRMLISLIFPSFALSLFFMLSNDVWSASTKIACVFILLRLLTCFWFSVLPF
ncbi:hypothetical protein C8J56DRAFT_155264 [Mycena floridula]|nr:hypothetical protein C8J56DRAFT_155264 [Mycena floridula]